MIKEAFCDPLHLLQSIQPLFDTMSSKLVFLLTLFCASTCAQAVKGKGVKEKAKVNYDDDKGEEEEKLREQDRNAIEAMERILRACAAKGGICV